MLPLLLPFLFRRSVVVVVVSDIRRRTRGSKTGQDARPLISAVASTTYAPAATATTADQQAAKLAYESGAGGRSRCCGQQHYFRCGGRFLLLLFVLCEGREFRSGSPWSWCFVAIDVDS